MAVTTRQVYVRSPNKAALNRWLKSGGQTTGYCIEDGKGRACALDGKLPGGTVVVLAYPGKDAITGKWNARRRIVE